jgi:hypothetical protein
LLFFSFILDLGRGYFMLLPFLMPVVYDGYLNFRDNIRFRHFDFVLGVVMVLYLDFLFSYFLNGMIEEFVCVNVVYCRNMDVLALKNIFFI